MKLGYKKERRNTAQSIAVQFIDGLTPVANTSCVNDTFAMKCESTKYLHIQHI